ncbi:MAG: hypothetical protein SNJ59_08585 [Aggregatilineales bacterium]
MAPLPRILTVDPTGAVARLTRAALELLNRPAIQIDVPGGVEALEEVGRGTCHLVVSALNIGASIKGFELALRIHLAQPDAAIVILGDERDAIELDDETRSESPFVYLRRPVDPAQFIRVIGAGLDGRDPRTAIFPIVAAPLETNGPLGTIPSLDISAAQRIVDALLTDVGAMAVVISSRNGELLLERGAVGYIDRERLISTLLPALHTTIHMRELVGGRPSALYAFDGETYDIFVLSAGYHHTLSLVFDGQVGSRQLGAVNRYGRRAAEDLIALIGAGAFMVEPPAPAEPRRAPRSQQKPAKPRPQETALAEQWDKLNLPVPAQPLKLDPIENLDPNLFDEKKLSSIDIKAADSLFDPDELAQIASEMRRGGPLSYDEARELGLIP